MRALAAGCGWLLEGAGLVGEWGAPDESVWGKSRGLDPGLAPYPLIRHLLDAAAMALHLWDAYLSENQRVRIAEGMGLAGEVDRARAVVGLCAGLHDVGKVSGFQFCSRHGSQYLSAELGRDRERMRAERFGHDVAGAQSVREVLAGLGFAGDEELRVAERLAEVVGGHHGRFHRLEDGIAAAFLGGVAWARQRMAHAAAVHGLLGAPQAPGVFKAPAAVLVTGLVILADWLVSQEDYLRKRQRRLEPVLEDHFQRSQRDAPGLLAEAGLARVHLQRKEFAQAYGIQGEPNPLQRSVMDELRRSVGEGRRGGILLVTAAPGDGKSETALEAERILSKAFGTQGYAFLLPTMATSDQMHGRVAQALVRQSGEEAGLTLVHSMAWLNSAYADEDLGAQSVLTCDGDEVGQGSGRAEADMRPQRWLRGPKRPLLAQFAVGTIDQALMAVLPVRHNALRLLALSGKTFIVDEAHAYDPYMQVLLGRLLNWLGAYGVPVVLLSATLPASVSDRLIKEYLQGAGHKTRALSRQTFPAPYPGWLYVDGASGRATQISPVRRQEQARARGMELDVVVEPVVHGGGGARARLAVIERLLSPIEEEGGTALVVCNTVGDAQNTYLSLRECFDQRSHDQGGSVQLLHARFPGEVREARTREVTQGLGRSGPRPLRRIVVATQVVEQSLDLDADIVISDLAPLSLLLQRAGRCWRHENHWARHGYPDVRGRPAWASGPRLVVLDPITGGGSTPQQWGEVYSEHLLSTTSRTLAGIEGGTVSIPGDVQDLVEAVHGDNEDFDWNTPGASDTQAWTAHKGKDIAERSMAGLLAVPRARSVSALHDLHHLPGEEDEWEVSTRLGADSVRLLCAYVHQDGRVTLDPEGEHLLPQAGVSAAGGAMPVSSVREVMRRTIPVRADWLKDADPASIAPPTSWTQHPMLADLRVLYQPVQAGSVQPVKVGGKTLRLDEDCGLVRR
ncbi:CRISPR-associated helicase Cas3' [Streptomyces dubilierae]|uniref:CRISPR-associated helicase Cas3 n=1 Tax=Streptomyces dubilierae TaxID=3075533 RepID=A0ABU2PJM3_9ACTN|nr:CRISPR-associated helicase Cas3' [Streptomyces sp. DSM 41921]MDT0392363.1 CRISPR-associated helicase Cas3' [Streptomyces sp. DSM 41921]